jgi:hypothetical protein
MALVFSGDEQTGRRRSILIEIACLCGLSGFGRRTESQSVDIL